MSLSEITTIQSFCKMMTVPDDANLATEEKLITPTIVANFAVSRAGNDNDWDSLSGFSSLDKSSSVCISSSPLTSFSTIPFSFLVSFVASNSQAYTHRKKLTPIAHKETQRF